MRKEQVVIFRGKIEIGTKRHRGKNSKRAREERERERERYQKQKENRKENKGDDI